MTPTTKVLDRQTVTAYVVISVVAPLMAILVMVQGIRVANLGATGDSVGMLALAGLLLALGPIAAARVNRSQGWTKVAIACLVGPPLLLLL